MSEIKNGKYEQDGQVHWYENGRLHREDGPAIEWDNGEKEWYLNGVRHRDNGPAVEYKRGIKTWYRHGELHREDGPAIEHGDGGKEFWLNGKRLTKKEFSEYLKKKKFREGLESMLHNKTTNKRKIKL